MPCLLRYTMLATRLATFCTRGLGHVPGDGWALQRAAQAPRAMPMLCSCSSSSAVATVAAPAAAAVSTASASMASMLFRQLFDSESSTYTYLLADSDTKEALLIDPVVEHVARDAQLVQDLGLTLILAVNTHVHADHVTGTGELKKRFPHLKSGISAAADAKADVLFKPQATFSIGQHTFKVLPTPGHTLGCVSYYTASGGGMVFTGDALLVRGCGRTDFQGGSSETLYGSVHSQLFTLPASTLVYPAHDYKGFTCSSIDEEKRLNPRLTKTLQEFVGIMANLNLPKPKKIDVAVPLNLVCGIQE